MYRMYFRAREKQLGALAALPEVLSSIPRNHNVDHNHLSWDPISSSSVSEDRDIMLTYME